jgi:hypothetical protein
MMTESVLRQSSESTADNPSRAALLQYGGGALLAVWLATGLLCVSAMDMRELYQAAGLFVALGGLALCCGIGAKLSACAAGRVAMGAIFFFTAVLISPPFHRSVASNTFDGSETAVAVGTYVPIIAALLLCLLGRIAVAPDEKSLHRVERFLATLGVRIHLALAAALATGAGLALAGLPMKTLAPRIAVLGAYVLAMKTVLALTRLPGGAAMTQASCGVMLAAVLITGGMRYHEMTSLVAAGAAALDRDDTTEATRLHTQARQCSKTLFAFGPEMQIERSWALFFERKNLPVEALQRWQQIADMQGLDRDTYPPIIRMQCRLGDSVMAWRRLVYGGFDAVTHPEILPGIDSLSQTANDVRAKLLAALVAWEQHAPDEEKQRRLEEVQKVAPKEPTSYTLLQRMGQRLPDTALWLPEGLLVGKKPSLYSVLGGIGELGEVESLVVLDKGQWEIAVTARGVPLREIWPIIRVELNGHEIGRSQVTRSEDREVPFVCEINRSNIYHVKIVFENCETQFEGGQKAMRGVAVSGVSFRKAKE